MTNAPLDTVGLPPSATIGKSDFRPFEPADREELLKAISFAIGCCSSVRPEKQAEAALDTVERSYELVPKR